MTVVKQGGTAFYKAEDGTITLFSVLMVLLILAISGAAVDIMRFEAVRAKMQSTLDRAVLAATDLDQTQDPVAVVNDYMAKAGLDGVISEVRVEESSNARLVTAWGEGILDTLFLPMSGIETLDVPALSTAEEKVSNVEISLVLDISGSMRWNNRIHRMRPAAQDFVTKVMTEQSNGVTTLNLVPFAGHVNPGDILFDYFRGERPKIKKNENNGWGNGDQDAPGDSLCNNNAENADEGAIDPSCLEGGLVTANDGYFTPWDQAISNFVLYFDTDGDGIYDRAHKIENFPESAPRDADDFFEGAAAFVVAQDDSLTSTEMLLGASIKGGTGPSKYYQVKGDENGPASDLGPTKNKGKLPGQVYDYIYIDMAAWALSYVSPNPEPVVTETTETTSDPAPEQNINMPGSCIEIYADEFATTAMPQSTDFVPHFTHWPIAADVMDWGWCPGEDTAIQYYSDDAAALNAFIGDMRMHDGTGLQYGMKYALSLLDPNTAPAVGHLIEAGIVDAKFAGRPIAWNDPETEKYIVVMTDGQTTDQFRPTDPTNPRNGEVELSVQGGESYLKMSDKNNNIAQLLQQCELAKSLGVTVFAIAYETGEAASADMRNCASSPGHFFHVQGEDIATAFDIVARQINNLRLIQ